MDLRNLLINLAKANNKIIFIPPAKAGAIYKTDSNQSGVCCFIASAE
jgi:hypothetical protein